MTVKLVELWILTTFILKISGQDTTDVHYNATVMDNEAPGKLVFNISRVTKCSGPSEGPAFFTSSVKYTYFVLEENSTALVVSNPIDLEALYVQEKKDVINVIVNCSKAMQVIIDVKVEPVNEFATVFRQSSYYVAMEENTEPGEAVFNFTKDMFSDDDVLEEITLHFGIENHLISEFNGFGKFNITSVKGTVYPTQMLDAETLNPGLFYLNITITDPINRTTWSKLIVNVTDVDDNHPVFTTDPLCKSSLCRVLNYTGILSLDDGLVYNLQPAPILAIDGDKTLNAQVTYNIIEAHPEWYENFVTINESGLIEFCTVCENFTTNVSRIVLVIQATELTYNQFSANATVLLEVQTKENKSLECCGTSPSPNDVFHDCCGTNPSPTDAFPNNCNCTLTTTKGSNDEPAAYVLKIVFPACASILVIVLLIVVVIVILKRNTRESTYNFKG
ncbi:hypothetical protein CHS0354_032171 [Potamilus streckersoni]|uniref:Cadherin domain-containing protein n=1 Tax=Potamilus streckersoni TaxID=2493646 RepID=A0AAE0THK0_9BIVA|nr:hypothetical protein CHS0354_032171 [Potamilus streckersoni]